MGNDCRSKIKFALSIAPILQALLLNKVVFDKRLDVNMFIQYFNATFNDSLSLIIQITPLNFLSHSLDITVISNFFFHHTLWRLMNEC